MHILACVYKIVGIGLTFGPLVIQGMDSMEIMAINCDSLIIKIAWIDYNDLDEDSTNHLTDVYQVTVGPILSWKF